MRIEWTPDLSVGVSEIDRQHQELFTRVNALLDAMSAGRGASELDRVMRFLSDYVVRHFGTEERYMRESGYPGFAAHKREHDAFVADVRALAAKCRGGAGGTVVVLDVQRHVGGWLRHHIGTVDRALAGFLTARMPAAGGPAVRA
jgi:hemerythrin